MANTDTLIRDPKGQTGKPNLVKNYSAMESAAIRAHLQNVQLGKTAAEKILRALEDEIGRDTGPVQVVNQLIKLVQAHSDSIADLQMCKAAITEVATMIAAHATMPKDQRARLLADIAKLLAHVNTMTSMKTRVESAMKNVAKATVSGAGSMLGSAREGVAKKLSQNPSLLFRLAGKLIAPGEKKNDSTIEQDVLKTKEGIFKKLSHKGGGSGMFGLGGDDWGDDGGEEGGGGGFKNFFRRMQGGGGTGGSETGGGGGSSELLEIDKKILEQVTDLTTLTRDDKERKIKDKEAGERADDEGKPVSATGLVTKEKKEKEGGGLFGWLAGLLGAGAIGTLLTFFKTGVTGFFEKLIPMFTKGILGIGESILTNPAIMKGILGLAKGLGDAGLILAAAFIGWETGKWLDDLTGHVMSNAVQKMAEWFLMPHGTRDEETRPLNHNYINPADTPTPVDKYGIKPGDTLEKYNQGWSVDKTGIGDTSQPASQPSQPASRPSMAVTMPNESVWGKNAPAPPSPAKVTAPAPASPSPSKDTRIVRVISHGMQDHKAFVVVQNADGSTEKRFGDRNTRNNNPGNIRWSTSKRGVFADSVYGAIGDDGENYAVFPTADAGRAAQKQLALSKNYRNLNPAQFTQKYAPASDHNDPVAYAKSLSSGGGKTPSQMSPDELTKFLGSMTRHEGNMASLRVVPVRVVNSERNAVPIESAAKAGLGRNNVTVVGGPTIASAAGQGGGFPVPPQRLEVDNPDTTVRAIRGLNLS